MIILLAEVALLVLLPFIQEPTATQLRGSNPQPAQSLLEQFYKQYYGTHGENEGTTEKISTWKSPPGKLNQPLLSNRNGFALAETPLTTLGKHLPLTEAPLRKVVSHGTESMMLGRMTSIAASSRSPKNDDSFVFFPSSGNTNSPVTLSRRNTDTMIFAPSPITSNNCQPGCKDYEGCFQSKCYSLLKRGPCNNGERLIERNGRAQCQRSNCQYPELPFGEQCFRQLEIEAKECISNKNLVLQRDGTFHCDCTGKNIYDPKTDGCYEAYKQGPCGASQYFILVDDLTSSSGTKAQCVNNPCGKGFVCHGPRCPHRSNCVQLNSACKTSSGNDGLLVLNENTMTLKCTAPEDIPTDVRHITNVPTFSCGKGSQRDRTGKCRKTSELSFS